jgi:hypothetical protein
MNAVLMSLFIFFCCKFSITNTVKQHPLQAEKKVFIQQGKDRQWIQLLETALREDQKIFGREVKHSFTLSVQAYNFATIRGLALLVVGLDYYRKGWKSKLKRMLK